ncbi:MAG: hypothetical protein QN168_13045 [Armatimonadota bacterium]|nr:hypothetical protein [Armatimonadota bacterium]
MERRTSGILTALLAAGLLTAFPASAQPETTVAPGGGPTLAPDAIQGRPSFEAGWAPAYFLWRDHEGIHLHWAAVGALRTFSGEITTEGIITGLRREGREDSDLRRTARTISWEAFTSGRDGFVFTVAPPGGWIRFALRVEGRLLAPERIFIGNRGVHPAGNPFAIRLGEAFRDRWPAVYWGRPSLVGAAAGYFIWFEEDGWHIRWLARGWARELSGLISTDGRFQEVRRVRLEDDDLVARDRSLIAWEARSSGGADGLDFQTTGFRLTFTLLVDGAPAGLGQIFLGARGAHPPQNPVRVGR